MKKVKDMKVKDEMVRVFGDTVIKMAMKSVGKSPWNGLYEIPIPTELKEELQQKKSMKTKESI